MKLRIPPNKGKGTVINRQFRNAMKAVFNAKAQLDNVKGGTVMRRLLRKLDERMEYDLENHDVPVDYAGLMKMLQLMGAVIDKEKYDLTARGSTEGSLEALLPRMGMRKPTPILMPPDENPENP